ncbi:MAG TPA: hypothetical protein VHX66_01475 [Solirubrobacteraceae bacterium]|jgi:hypothetical protein|nr:hypothetical protein [Solirubrobacteraceae bacterium]
MQRVKRWLAASALLLTLLLVPAGVGLASPSRAASTSHVFTVAVPSGFHDDTAKFAGGAIRFELVLAGSVSNGFAVNINVVRERSQGASIGQLAQASKTDLKRLNKAHDFSTLQDLTIGGAPARAFSFAASFGGGKVLHDRQAYVIHDGWGYVVTFSALPSQYAGSVSAFSECLTSWRWV